MLDAAAGLTRMEAENAFSLSLVRHGRLAADVLWELKGGMLKKSGLLTLHRGGETFADLGGLEALKSFCTRALRPGRPAGVRARGVLLLGPPGTGKCAFCKALGSETGRPTLFLDVGALARLAGGPDRGGLRQALRLVDAMAPCVVMLDEVEKALSGVASSGQTDSGVSARMFASFLAGSTTTSSDAFVVCTANDVSKLPPEFSRAERFDAMFFLDLPGRPREGADLADVPGEVRARPGPAPAAGSRLDRRRDQGVLPAGGPAGRPAGRGGPEHRPGGRHGRRGGREAPAVGQRPLPVGRPAGLYTRGSDVSAKSGRNINRDPSSN